MMTAKKKNAKKTVNFDPERFQISAWGGSMGLPLTEKYYQSLEDAAFTMITGGQVSELDDAQKHGIKVLVHSPILAVDRDDFNEKKLLSEFKKLYRKIGSHPALAGYFLRDEPKTGYFKRIGKVRELIRQVDQTHEGYINLLPRGASLQQLEASSYEEYLERYIRESSPDWIGYDYYALHIGGEKIIEGDFWENLRLYRKNSQENRIPFRYIMLSVAHFCYRIVTEDDLNFQAFSALAYGAKGLEYFTYAPPDVGNYRRALLDWFGEKTPLWYAAAALNKRIQVMAPLLNRLESTKVYHYSNTGRIPEKQGPPADPLVRRNPGNDILVGEFKHTETGEDYVMLVNKNLADPVKLDLELSDPKKKVMRVSPVKRDVLREFTGEQLWLAPGGGVLLKPVRK